MPPTLRRGASSKHGNKAGGRLAELVRCASLSFLAADANGDEDLEFHEFVNVIPAELREKSSAAALREIFDMADTNNDARISKDEFFFWSLSWAFQNSGGATASAAMVEEVFREHDSSGDGELNLIEFQQAVDRFGFGSVASQVFSELDRDQTGRVSYQEFNNCIRTRKATDYSKECRQLLLSMTFDIADQSGIQVVSFDTSPWTAGTTDDLRDGLRTRMGAVIQQGMPARPFDVWIALVVGAGLPLTTRTMKVLEFKKGMQIAFGFSAERDAESNGSQRGYKRYQSLSASKLSLDGSKPKDTPDDVLTSAFNEIDSISQQRDTGSVTVDDLRSWINGSVLTLERARQISFATRQRKPGFEAPLEAIDWTEEILREEMQTMLLAVHPPLGALDLMLAYDRSEDNALSRKEFLGMFKKLVGNEGVWTSSNVKDACIALFNRIAGTDAEVDIEELQMWMVKGWAKRKNAMAQLKAVELRDLCRGSIQGAMSVDDALLALEREAEASEIAGTGNAILEVTNGQLGVAGEQLEPVVETPSTMDVTAVANGGVGKQESRSAVKLTPPVAVTPRGVSIRKLFQRIDIDGNGVIEKAEATKVSESLGCNPTTFWAVLQKYDANNDGGVDIREFEAAIKGRILAAFFPGVPESEWLAHFDQALQTL